MHIHHLVLSVSNFKKSLKFYTVFLGKPKVTKWDAHWQIGETKLFITFPYKKSAKVFDKHNIGLNHLSFGLKNLPEFKRFELKLKAAKIKNSGILTNKYNGKEYIWFDDPDKIRLEFFLR